MKLEIPDRHYAAFIFDCDGTIADTMPAHFAAWHEALGEAAVYFPMERHIAWAGMPTEVIVQKINREHGTQFDPEEFTKRKEQCYLDRLDDITPVLPVLDFARAKFGLVPMAIASGGRRDIVERTLGVLGILDLFSVVVTAEDYSHPKPAPDPFLVAAEKMGVSPADCLVFEDSLLGIESAKRAGMDSIFVPTNEPAEVHA